MYNRYIPEDMSYAPVEPSAPSAPPRRAAGGAPRPPLRLPDFLAGKEGLSGLCGGREAGGLSGLLKGLKLDKLDSGDILLLLITLYLLVEGDDLELVIALGLVLLMGLGEEG